VILIVHHSYDGVPVELVNDLAAWYAAAVLPHDKVSITVHFDDENFKGVTRIIRKHLPGARILQRVKR
jgi:hypothetical protein